MYVKNFDRYSVKSHAKYTGLRTESTYRWPYAVKYVTWLLVAATVITSCTILILYGTSFGTIKTYLWLTTVLSSVFISVLIIAPVRIFIFSLVDAFFAKKKPPIINRRICPSLLANPDNPDKKKSVLKYRQLNASLYTPTPLSKLQNRLEDVKYNIELRNVAVDLILHVFFMAVLLYIVQINKTEMGYYSTEVIRNLVVRGNYTNSIPFSEVTTYETFMEYLKETLLPALLLDHTEYSKSYPNRKRRGVQEYGGYANLPADVKKRQILNDLAGLEEDKKEEGGVDVFRRGWTLSPTLKLLGKPRLRQLRVKTGSCKQLLHLEGRNLECAADLTLFNVERGKFSLQWNPEPPKGLTTSQVTPWTYQSASDSQSLPVYGKYFFYPGGGYVLTLARNFRDAQIILEFLDAFQWVDMRTRAVFIEFTVYCVNTNLFSVVTLIVEKTASGYIIPNYQIDTSKFTFTVLELEEVMFAVLWFLFACFLFFFILREGVKIYRTTVASYLKRGFALVDLAIILLGLLTVTFSFCRNHYVAQVLKKLEESDNSVFISFIYAAAWHNWCIYIEALLVCLSFFKLYRLLTFRAVFFKLQITLNHCYRHFINLFISQMVLIFAFAFFFNLTLANYTCGFSSFDVSLSTMVWRAVANDDNFEVSIFINTPWYLGPLFFTLLVISITMLFVNLFTAVTSLNFREIQKVALVDKYNILEYVKHALTSKGQSDILHLKEGRPVREEKSDPNVMRLKGGEKKEKKSSKKKKKTRKNRKKNVKKSPKREHEEEEGLKTRFCDFLTKKPYDMTVYQDLAEERVIGMKHLMLSLVSEDKGTKRTKTISRENALKALFCSFTADRAKSGRDNSVGGRYFFVADKSTTGVYDANRFLQMKKIVEEKARENGWLEDEDINLDEMNEIKDKLSALDKKLCLLLRKQKM